MNDDGGGEISWLFDQARLPGVSFMYIQQGKTGWTWDGVEYDQREFTIKFNPSFTFPPTLTTSFVLLDTWPINGDTATRIWCNVLKVECDHAVIEIATQCGKNKIGGAEVQWTAFGK